MAEWRLEVDVSLHFEGLSLEARLDSAETHIAIAGASGAGKSTLLRVLAGAERRAVGRVKAGGETWLDTDKGVNLGEWQRRVGWVPQDALLFPHLSVEANLRFGERSEAPAFDDLIRLLEIVPLLGRSVRHLSGGERQRVALGRALLTAPRLLLLDEPFAALDRPLRRRLTAMLNELRQAHPVPTVLVTHDAEELGALADERWLLEGGRLAPMERRSGS